MKYFCFRFDIDTHKCLHEGVPRLLNLACELNVKYTFFVNFGQAVNRSLFINELVRGTKKTIGTKSLSALTKLGIKDYISVALFNPFIGTSSQNILGEILRQGHEIGLHGGRNHETWLRQAHTWPITTIRRELMWGINQMKHVSDLRMAGFASPGWNGSKKINTVLEELHFSYVADIHSDKPYETIKVVNGLKLIPTNITGEPEGVGYLEYCRALLMNDTEIMTDFTNKLQKRNKLAVVYDHPYFAGVQELKLVKQFTKTAQKMNYKVATMHEIAQHV